MHTTNSTLLNNLLDRLTVHADAARAIRKPLVSAGDIARYDEREIAATLREVVTAADAMLAQQGAPR